MAASACLSHLVAPAASSRLWSSKCVLDRSRSTVSPAAGESGRYADGAESTVFAEAPLAAPDLFAESVDALRDVVLARGPSGRRHPVDPRREIETMLATTQDADGSFGGQVDRTAAALAALICLGHSRRKGTRRRVVEKAAHWLSQRAKDPLAELALELLSRTEGGGGLPERVEVEALLGASVEGKALDRALQL
jgi:hypothetical protein